MDDTTVKERVNSVWEDAVEEWRRESALDEEDLELVEDLDLLEEFEYFWDADFERVGYEAPSIPKDWKTQSYSDDIQSWAQVSKINMALDDLGTSVRVKVENELGIE